VRWNVAWRDAALGLGLAAAAWLLYLPILRLWWTHDDLFHLHFLRDHAPAWYLWDAAAWRQWTPRVLTPLLFLSLDADRVLFGPRPAAFYLHQLVSLSLVPAALYGVLRLWLPRLWAALGALVFLLGPPVASLAPVLMERHYIEAVLLGTLSCGLWVLSLRRTGQGAAALAVASAILWFLASMAKEIAVPLVLFLPLIPEGTLRERLRRAAPLGAALLAYVVVRARFLGTLGGGYGFAVEARDLPWAALRLPGKVAAEIRGVDALAAGLLSAVVLAALALTLARGRQAALRLGAALALSLAPVLPVSTRMEPRFAVPAWLVAAVAFAFAGQDLSHRSLSERGGRRRLAAALLALAGLAGGLAAYHGDWPARLDAAERQSRENRFFLTLGPGDLLRRPLAPPGALGELRWWKEDVLGRPRGAGWFLDDLYLCLHPEAGTAGRIWTWDAGSRRMADLTPRVPDLRRRFCSTVRRDAALRAELRTRPFGLSWSLGPWETGRYGFVTGGGVTAIEVPRTGAFQLPKLAPVSLRVKYESPEGWVTYSPELTLDPARRKVLRWAR